jgi:H/ACA ribonucleoprotein complex subunit 4
MHIHEPVKEEKIREIFNEYIGKINQLPPKKSAVKRQIRTREIYYLEILEINGQDVLFKVGCEAGTYIRVLCTNIGKSLNTNAHMQELVRTKVAHFTYENWISLHDLKDAYEDFRNGNDKSLKKLIHPFEDAVKSLPKIYVLDSAVDSLCHGAFLSTPGVAKLDSDIETGDLIALMTLKGELIGLGVTKMNAQNILRQEKAVAVGNLRIFMDRGVYPKFVRKTL